MIVKLMMMMVVVMMMMVIKVVVMMVMMMVTMMRRRRRVMMKRSKGLHGREKLVSITISCQPQKIIDNYQCSIQLFKT